MSKDKKGLQVRELPEHVYAELVDGARRSHRSLAQEAVSVLERGLNTGEPPKNRRKAMLARIAEQPLKVKQAPADLVRKDRDR